MNKPTLGLDPQLTEAIVGTLREPIIILDKNLRVLVASRAFYDTFNVEYEQVHGKVFYELGNGEWNIPALRTLLEQIITEKTTIEEYEVDHNFKKLGLRTMLISAREIKFGNRRQYIFISIADVTEQRNTQLNRVQ